MQRHKLVTLRLSTSQCSLRSCDVDSEVLIVHIEERSPSCYFHFKTWQDWKVKEDFSDGSSTSRWLTVKPVTHSEVQSWAGTEFTLSNVWTLRVRKLPYSLTSNAAEKVCCGLFENFAKIFQTPILHTTTERRASSITYGDSLTRKSSIVVVHFINYIFQKKKNEKSSPQKFSQLIVSRMQPWIQFNCFMRQNEAVGRLNIETSSWWVAAVHFNVTNDRLPLSYLNFECDRSTRAIVRLYGLHAGCQTENPVKNCGNIKQNKKQSNFKFKNLQITHTTEIFHSCFSSSLEQAGRDGWQTHPCFRGCRGSYQFGWRCSRPERTPSLFSPLAEGLEIQPAGTRTAWRLDPCWRLLEESEPRK